MRIRIDDIKYTGGNGYGQVIITMIEKDQDGYDKEGDSYTLIMNILVQDFAKELTRAVELFVKDMEAGRSLAASLMEKYGNRTLELDSQTHQKYFGETDV